MVLYTHDHAFIALTMAPHCDQKLLVKADLDALKRGPQSRSRDYNCPTGGISECSLHFILSSFSIPSSVRGPSSDGHISNLVSREQFGNIILVAFFLIAQWRWHVNVA